MSKKQKNQLLFIVNSNNNIKHDQNNVSDNNLNNIFVDIRPSFPPNLTTNDLIKNAVKSNTNRPKTFPNAFIAYRMALIKECRNKNWKLPSMGEFSKITRNSWNTESEHVKNFYVSLVKEAKSNYKQNNLQIVLDKHMSNNMNYVQESGETYDTNVRILPTIYKENSQNLVQNTSHYNVRFIDNSSLIDSSSNSEMNSDREYIEILEQIVDSLLRSKNRFT
ncbi:uncharacterized protein OCT59_027575 [Rhizophagus irregularis]|uniref:HMG box domain-containing protein n=2 Tax=Rhizophagus irregularis TaxID=588596 RepID=U9TPQ4_RHIID|nr:hypothetical protein GLOIN_2v1641116 [Rhizophagus irregularis DAOM 181602=DAOM 197198]EXX57427.1 hypothetical protein RirG_207350 [Rhizophagus irregularis DAOM 197198w]UZO07288.1 hypothetical protein OCT59_027575 [Rhizophagus irregularis]POG68002.1 hypothetical protein GLOIN_2v1641116 [Rhizophagus irregularis DAOM 181602=DAOM 197198]CAG8519378.1 19156_t:CDS:1 [Rhizophagus irregularis]GBC14189.1 hypothetical protein GLOIN_2v1641116 [Rhizophagus irregularis DAOM 181602=DAOM 197198]|eukprot:XP_025174868.1 hypothetical protein GLOIN_2v1641116 [Rhizophagus irregularis DAOM 181602=DAOM 197198]